ncbi:CMP-N-acetylneuraminate-beta-1,4-galactoside alpha-2,3-sialyltransferase isoform X1 [Motacilla alba alba]|uniref:CMP-N-acetylneuraminate-beta-1,4-galactoside alpha-2,3-sialyltransferase isoform X1 n=3 Tax=Motacilla alba alba TaxID=1094192 RepID=UPI0018D51A3A|nr:CMP-N-acetylneuraminate-beta-1,4-galactoside alpha-2,3-sialyltransferase isoform X1 [Motacilla alba alba]XP_038000104.1 CMP-N-acetylneuraminate-beta-1,4-galactoside alpha-2,3-sialyltransferase isoform X1 [Motacilla alba alba]XP_038000105.1 CMP-N-acetylneuraminate-beta-1,4-galactoside alpha-2,3-sialyltransferase isoform X1 [Motacilla alba alba]
MGLLVFMRNLLLALCLFLVLGFLYYSAWKLHLLRWEDSRIQFTTSPYPVSRCHGTAVLGAVAVMCWATQDSVVLSFDSVGHTIGSGRRERKTVAIVLPLSIPSHLAADPGKDRAQKEPTETMTAPGPAIPKYDKLGFLLNLDSKLPPELASKYANFSEGMCKPGYASALMTVIFPKFSKPAPMFLDDSFRKWARIRDFVPPFGIKGQDNLIKAILSATKDYRLTPALDSLSCRRCIIVGNGGVLANKSLGLKIDDYDVVVRLNSAPVKGFEKDVGGKTTLRITYPEGAIQKMEQYEKDSLFVLAGFKWQDFKWLKYIVYKEKVSASDGFWKSVATRVPREPHEIRILNPFFIQEAAFSFIGLPFNNGLMGRGNIPTLGSVAITMALHNCDEVAVAGFGYDMSSPNAPLHYYENIKMSAIKESWTHNIQREKEFLRKLVKARVITDLTSGI